MNKDERRREVVKAIIASKGEVIMVPPDVLLGYTEGRGLRLSYYSRMNMPHPKSQAYYDSLEDPAPDPHIWRIFSGIKRSGKIDSPITLYLKKDETKENKILVLDGATRVTCVSFVRKDDPSAFQTIPAILFQGTEDEARSEMIMRNVEGRSRALKAHELVAAVGAIYDKGYDEMEVGRVCGINDRSGLTRCCILVHERASDGVKMALRDGFLDIMQAARLTSLDRDKQDEQAENAAKGLAIRYDGSHASKPKRQINPAMGELRRIKGIERNLDTISDFFTSGNMDEARAKRCREIAQRLYADLHRIRNKIKIHGERTQAGRDLSSQ